MRRALTLLAPALLALSGLSAPAAAQSTLGFEVDGTQFEFDVPEGFCTVTGEHLAASQYLASLDRANDTLADVHRCGTFGKEYVQVKIQKQRATIPLPREQFLALASEQLQSQFGDDTLNSAVDQAERDLAAGTDGAITLETAPIQYGGKDAECVYLTGSSVVEAEGEKRKVIFATCITLIGSYSLAINCYMLESEGGNTEALKARARAAAQAISAR